MCEESQSNEENEVCIIRKNIILKYDKNLNFFDKNDDKLEFTTQPLSIIDIDFDDKKEIVIARPCGIRLSYEYDVYKFYNTTDKFDIDKEQLKLIDDTVSDINGPRNSSFYFRWNSIFDKKIKL